MDQETCIVRGGGANPRWLQDIDGDDGAIIWSLTPMVLRGSSRSSPNVYGDLSNQ